MTDTECSHWSVINTKITRWLLVILAHCQLV